MNSLDPWDPIIVDATGDVIFPRPYYGHPFYREIPSWVTEPSGETRTAFDGAFISGDPLATGGLDMVTAAARNTDRRTGLIAEIAPIVAPATGGISVLKELDDKQVLHVKICVDGKCYETSMDLAPALGAVMNKLARWHQDQHSQMQAPPPAATAPAVVGAVVGTCESIVGNATEAIVDELVGRHIQCVCGSFLDDIGNAVKGVASGVAGGVASTLKQLKGPIAAAAGVAATAGAALIPGVGPFVAPIAGKLANDIVNSTIGDNPQATQAVAQAKQAAKTDPTVALALDQAQKAVANATIAHHVHRTARHARRGQPQAQQQIAQVVSAAQSGDPAAKAVLDLINNALHGTSPSAPPSAPPSASGWYDIAGWYDIVGAGSPLDDVRARGKALATAKRGGAAGGAIHSLHDGHWHTYSFSSLDDAIDWLQRVTRNRSSFTYAAAYEKDRDGNAYIQGEEFGGPRAEA